MSLEELDSERKLVSFFRGVSLQDFGKTTKSELLFDFSSGRCFVQKYLSSGLSSRVIGIVLSTKKHTSSSLGNMFFLGCVPYHY